MIILLYNQATIYGHNDNFLAFSNDRGKVNVLVRFRSLSLSLSLSLVRLRTIKHVAVTWPGQQSFSRMIGL